jgi:hypothetical protein
MFNAPTSALLMNLINWMTVAVDFVDSQSINRTGRIEGNKMRTANQIRAERAARRCSQHTLARLSGLSRYLISLFECGYREPTKAEMAKVRTALIKASCR